MFGNQTTTDVRRSGFPELSRGHEQHRSFVAILRTVKQNMRVPFTSRQVIRTEPGFFDLSTNMSFATPQNINIAIAPTNHVRDLSILGSSRQNKLIGHFIAARAFADCRRYGLFLKAQYEIERDLAEIYRKPRRSTCLRRAVRTGV